MKGNLHRRGRQSWRLKYDEPSSTGARETRYVTLRANTRAQAQAQAAKIIASVASGDHVDPSSETVSQFIERWLEIGPTLASLIRLGRDMRSCCANMSRAVSAAVPIQKLRASIYRPSMPRWPVTGLPIAPVYMLTV